MSMNRSGRVGEFPIFKGAHRAKLILGVDQRVAAFAVLLIVVGIVNPLILWPIAGAVILVGRIAGAKSPYFFDEVSAFVSWRFINWHSVMPADAYWTSCEAPYCTKNRKAKA